MDPLALIIVSANIAAAIALNVGIITAIAQARVTQAAIEAISRQPAMTGTVTSTMFIGLAMCETAGIYGLLIAILMLFANPLVTIYINFVG